MATATYLGKTGYENGFGPDAEYAAPDGAWNAAQIVFDKYTAQSSAVIAYT